MKDTIFVPKIINVGYQKRNDTFTGKLAYVVYTDEKGTLRKQASWDGWRNKDIEPDTFDNTPTSGFVLNKKVGDTKSHWNFRQAYCRIYDPRGFEFEITFENLLYILENTNSIVGKGLEGEFVYGWDGKDLVLLPTCSPDYKEIEEYTKAMYSDDVIKGKDLVMGYTYKGKDGALYMYLGKYKTYSTIYHYNEPQSDLGNQFWFAKFDNVQALNSFDINTMSRNYGSSCMIHKKSISAKFLISVYDSNISPHLSDCINYIDGTCEISPIDKTSIKVKFFTESEWVDYVQQYLNRGYSWWSELPFCSKPHNDVPNNYCLMLRGVPDTETAGLYKFNGSTWSSRTLLEAIKLDSDTIKQIYKDYKPCYIDMNLQNGRPCERKYEWRPL